jgi:hypothetical protein
MWASAGASRERESQGVGRQRGHELEVPRDPLSRPNQVGRGA